MDTILKHNVCKFLEYLKEEVALLDLNKQLDNQSIPLEPEDLLTEGISREHLPQIIKYLTDIKIIKKEIKLTDNQYNDAKIADPFVHQGIDRYAKYNIILNNDFYKNYDLITKKLGCYIDIKPAKNPTYDKTRKILTFSGKDIDFSKKIKQYEILDCLFGEPNKEWEYIDIEEKLDPEFDFTEMAGIKRDKLFKSRYNASGEINDNIAKKTTCTDFLIRDMKKVKINPQYL